MSLFLRLLVFASVLISLTNCERGKKQPDPKHLREWMSAETDFYNMEQQLQKALGDDWDSFRLYMTEKIQEHHSSHQSCKSKPSSSSSMSAMNEREAPPFDDCQGQAGLTESEYILHQALDVFGEKIGNGDASVLHRYHNMAHSVFERTRKLLEKMALLQGSEYEDAAVAKQQDMKYRYKRLVPVVRVNSTANAQ